MIHTSVVPMTPADLGLGFWKFLYGPISALTGIAGCEEQA